MYSRFLKRRSNDIKILSLVIEILQISFNLTLLDKRACVTTTFQGQKCKLCCHLSINKMPFISSQDDGRSNKTCLPTTFCYKFIFVLIHLVFVKILLKLMLKKHNNLRKIFFLMFPTFVVPSLQRSTLPMSWVMI